MSSDAERDARVAECMGFLNALFYAYCHPEVSSADPRIDMWAWARNLCEAIQPNPNIEDTREQSVLGRCMEYAGRAEQAARRAELALEAAVRERQLSERSAVNARESASQAMSSKNLAEQACSRAEAAASKKHR